MTLSIDIQHNSIECHYAECRYTDCRYADCRYSECHYAECRDYLNVMLNNVVMLCVVSLEAPLVQALTFLTKLKIFHFDKRSSLLPKSGR